MSESFEIGVSIALRDGVAESIAAARRDAASVEAAVGRSAVTLDQLRRMAAGRVPVAEAPRPAPKPWTKPETPPREEHDVAPARETTTAVVNAVAAAPVPPLPSTRQTEARPPDAAPRQPPAVTAITPAVVPMASAPAARQKTLPRIMPVVATPVTEADKKPAIAERDVRVAPAPAAVATPASMQVSPAKPTLSARVAVPSNRSAAAPLAQLAAPVPPPPPRAPARAASVPVSPGPLSQAPVRAASAAAVIAPVEASAPVGTAPSPLHHYGHPEFNAGGTSAAAGLQRTVPKFAVQQPDARQEQAPAPTGGDVFLDGLLVGRWMARHLAREAMLPSSGPTGFDPRRSPERPGATLGGL